MLQYILYVLSPAVGNTHDYWVKPKTLVSEITTYCLVGQGRTFVLHFTLCLQTYGYTTHPPPKPLTESALYLLYFVSLTYSLSFKHLFPLLDFPFFPSFSRSIILRWLAATIRPWYGQCMKDFNSYWTVSCLRFLNKNLFYYRLLCITHTKL